MSTDDNVKGYVVKLCKRGFFSYCSEVDVRNKVVILKIVASFEFLPKWQKMKQDTQPSLLISLPFH